MTATRSMTATRLVPALVAAGLLGGAGATFVAGSQARGAAPASLAVPVAAPPAGSAFAAADFAQVAERDGPAVVNIGVSGMLKASTGEGDDAAAAEQRGAPGMDPNDPFFEFFKRFQGPNGFGGPQQAPRDMPMRGQGSGFIVSADGTILTNAHGVRDAKDVTVKLTDRREFRAKVLGSDPQTDVAVLKTDAKNLPTLPPGNARDLKVGEWVLAIGSPFGLENSVPIDLATQVKDQIVATGRASHARLGVAVQEVNRTFADAFKLGKPEGAPVSNVDAGSPAHQAGLKSGDVIRKVNGQPIVASGDLLALIGQAKPGEKVTLEVLRQGQREELSARLGDASDKKAQLAKADEALGKGRLGLALRPLQAQEQRDSGVDGGLVVQNAAGPAALAGVQPVDLLMRIDGKPVLNIEQVREAIAKSGRSVALLIQRDGNTIFVPVRIG